MEEKKEETKEESKVEAKEEKKVETKQESKPNKKKKEKKKIPPFDKIDVTTATDDDIIRSGIKHNTKGDITCYGIMAIVFILAILPVALRIIIPRPVTTEEADIVYYTLTCYKTTVKENYELNTTLISSYRDGKVNTIDFDFKWFKKSEAAKEGYLFTEVEDLLSLKKDGVDIKNDTSKAKIIVDFQKNPSLRDEEKLKDFVYHSTTQIGKLTNEMGYSCTTDSKTVTEVIDIATREKVK